MLRRALTATAASVKGYGGLAASHPFLAVSSARRFHATGTGRKSPLDSDQTGASGLRHFDLQDVDADRLTHFFWDRNEDGGSPYGLSDTFPFDMDEYEMIDMTEFMLEDMQEGGGMSDSMMEWMHRDLISKEYLGRSPK